MRLNYGHSRRRSTNSSLTLQGFITYLLPLIQPPSCLQHTAKEESALYQRIDVITTCIASVSFSELEFAHSSPGILHHTCKRKRKPNITDTVICISRYICMRIRLGHMISLSLGQGCVLMDKSVRHYTPARGIHAHNIFLCCDSVPAVLVAKSAQSLMSSTVASSKRAKISWELPLQIGPSLRDLSFFSTVKCAA